MALSKAQAIVAVYTKLEELMGTTLPDRISESVLEGIQQSWTDLATSIAEVIDETVFTTIRAYRTTSQSFATAPAHDTIVFNTVDSNSVGSSAYNSSTGVFTVPADGWYEFSWRALSVSTSWSVGDYWLSGLSIDGGWNSNDGSRHQGTRWVSQVSRSGYADTQGYAKLYLTTSQTAQVDIAHDQGGAVSSQPDSSWVYFTVSRVA